MDYVILYLEGVLTFISPCFLPMLPVYLSYFAAGQAGRRQTVINAAGFTAGFTAVFVALGALASTLGKFIFTHTVAVNIISGTIVILLGLSVTGVIKIPFFRGFSGNMQTQKKLGFFSALLLGVVFSVGWTPCVGAYLGAALLQAGTSGGVVRGVFMLFVYSMGLGLPLIASAVLIERLKGAFDFIKRNYKVINLVSGILLIFIGIAMATGLMGKFLAILSF